MSLILAIAALSVQPAAPPPALTAHVVAEAIRRGLPQRFSAEVALVEAANEGDRIVLTFELSDDILAAATPETLSARFSQGFCADRGGRGLLAGPLSLRIDGRSPAGRRLAGAVLEACPGEEQAG